MQNTIEDTGGIWGTGFTIIDSLVLLVISNHELPYCCYSKTTLTRTTGFSTTSHKPHPSKYDFSSIKKKLGPNIGKTNNRKNLYVWGLLETDIAILYMRKTKN